MLTTLVVRILIGLYRRTCEDTGSHALWSPVAQAVACMEAHFRSKELSLDKLAAEAKLSERQFSRLFRKQVGMSYITYLHNLRIDAACRMMKSSLDSIPSIASAVGYLDMKFFRRLFKRKTGLTPGQYRTASLANRAPAVSAE
ncbi:AraC family transcriptional regulator [Paenibacillus alkaliterrae]|uniref:helix-turn-helix domain-containing protein n=1 Tax=Paenibacillus alkaliterrae TaxID=320909 RepID=UPI001F2444F7|nr:AraC family transcriptional regulator [Paenibacillus alkaliterrae]MCF2941311.1 AraC family transcriptional regulator [Paenibacillus alkaliterrae]